MNFVNFLSKFFSGSSKILKFVFLLWTSLTHTFYWELKIDILHDQPTVAVSTNHSQAALYRQQVNRDWLFPYIMSLQWWNNKTVAKIWRGGSLMHGLVPDSQRNANANCAFFSFLLSNGRELRILFGENLGVNHSKTTFTRVKGKVSTWVNV